MREGDTEADKPTYFSTPDTKTITRSRAWSVPLLHTVARKPPRFLLTSETGIGAPAETSALTSARPEVRGRGLTLLSVQGQVGPAR